MRRCPMRSTSYLPDFPVFSSLPGAVCDVEGAESDVCAAALHRRGTVTSQVHAGGTHKRKLVVQIASRARERMGEGRGFIRRPHGAVGEPHADFGLMSRAATSFPAMKVFSHVGKSLGSDGRAA